MCYDVNLQAHLAPSGYLKLPNVSIFCICIQAKQTKQFWFCMTWKFINSIFLFFQNIAAYLSKCSFLPKINNELPDERNATYKQRFTSLQNLVLIMVSLYETITHFKSRQWFWLLIICLVTKYEHYTSLSLMWAVWTWHCFNTEGDLLVRILSRWSFQSNYGTTAGNKLVSVITFGFLL